MASVRLLDQAVYELIAAGEVIERPSSVVKELLENSIDAKATAIEIEIKGGGKDKIRVTDNGIGMSFEDCKTAFLRHATSKVSAQEDLDRISTLGFRGEALASVCAVSKVELLSKQRDVTLGTRYVIAGGEELMHEEAGTPDGTTILIQDLFFNVPARLKFLKRDATEGNAIADIVEKIAISHPEISITFRRERKLALQTPGNGKLIDSIYAVYGKSFAETLIEASYTLDEITVTGYISKPMECRVNRSMQHCFINGRYVKSKTCAIALEEGYKGSIMVGKFPACILFLSVPVNTIDVNVHPSKIEVRFSDEQAILQAVYTAVKQAITRNSNPSDLESLPQKKKQITNYADDRNVGSEQVRFSMRSPSAVVSQAAPCFSSSCYSNPKQTASSHSFVSGAPETRELQPSKEPDKPDSNDVKRRIILEEPMPPSSETSPPKPNREEPKSKEQSIRMIGELFETYILAESETTFYLMDKHAAHERMIYEDIRTTSGELSRQMLLKPMIVNLSKAEHEAALSCEELITKFGFCLEDFGQNTILVREIPMILEAKNCREVLLELLNNLSEHKQDVSPAALDHIYHTIACKAAIKANDENRPEELEKLFFEVFYHDNIRYCPHGRPVLLSYSKERIEKQFGR